MRPLVVFNPTAHGGAAPQRLELVRAEVDALGARVVESTASVSNTAATVAAALDAGCDLVIAAGGDGTVHEVINALWRVGSCSIPADVRFGAIGLGSSNDFHKPYDTDVPLRLNGATAAPRDLVRVRYTTGDDAVVEKLCVVSASFGATAAANEIFNRRGWTQRFMARMATNLAVGTAALRGIATHRDIPAQLEIAGAVHDVELSNLNVLKTPYLAGTLHFDLAVAPDDGCIAVALCEGMSRLELASILVSLHHGEFRDRPKTRSWHVPALQVATRQPVAFELDGDVTYAATASFEVVPGGLLLCGT